MRENDSNSPGVDSFSLLSTETVLLTTTATSTGKTSLGRALEGKWRT